MAEVIDKYQIVRYISKLLPEARDRVWIVSPYIKLPDFLNLDLDNPKYEKIRVDIVCGKHRIDAGPYNYFSGRNNVHLHFCKKLHSKIYMNDQYGIICSMNLYDYSIRNNIETGVYFSKFDQLYEQCRRKMNGIWTEAIPYTNHL
ncbi:MAG: phospholipase D-like domain-containing protein [Bacteroidota bacterium]